MPARRRIPVGLLFSCTGFYGAVGRNMLNGALLGIEEVNAWPGSDFVLEPVITDPGGGLRAYYEACEILLRHHHVTHVVGCYTSASRRRVLPLVEAANALLWHPARYEGFESSDHVIYVGAPPSQHIVPLARYMLEHVGRDAYCIGSHYIWTWETVRVLREIIGAENGRLVAERTLPLGETGVEHIVEEIVRLRPSAVLNTLVGKSSYSFFGAYHAAARRVGRPMPPVLSCSLCEPELGLIGPEAGTGHIVCSPWFQCVDSAESRTFLARYRARFGSASSPSVDAQTSYASTVLLGRAVRRAGDATVHAVRRAVQADHFVAPQGPMPMDPDNNHFHATPRIARSNARGQFDLLWEAPAPVAPDPYLVWLDRMPPAARPHPPRGGLRIVS